MSAFRAVLIQTPCYELSEDRLEPPLGLLYLATWVNQNGHDATIVDLSSIPSDEWIQAIPFAEVYGFSTYTTTYDRTLRVLAAVKQVNPDAWTVAGGPHASALPEDVARDFDYVVKGEGETAFLSLLDSLRAGSAPLPVIKGTPILGLDSLPFHDYSLTDVTSYRRIVDGSPSLSVLSARGCPYRCVFCNSTILGSRQALRFRSAEHVFREICSLRDKWGIASIRFQDDTFTLNVSRLRKLTELLDHESIAYRCFGRVDRCRPEVTDLLAKGGCRHIAFGVESGSAEILRRMRKDQTVDDIRHGIANAKASGLMTRVYLIVGFPGETWTTVEQTIDLMLECEPDEFSVYPLIPYPGTELYRNPKAFGITHINPDFSQYFQVRRERGTGYVMSTPGLDIAELASMRRHVIKSLEHSITWAGDSRNHK